METGLDGRTVWVILARYPDQRALPTADPALVPNAIEELLRFEAPRFPTWEIDESELTMVHTSTVRGFSSVPIHLG